MFENILGQAAVKQLEQDIKTENLAPSLLFEGPPYTAKGSAALELGRVLSCEHKDAAWNCSCSACAQHRLLAHPDLLMIGPRDFSTEAAAAAAAFLRNGETASRFLLLRSIRKLLLRFNPLLWRGEEARLNKLVPHISSLHEALEELSGDQAALAPEKIRKKVDSLVHTAYKLESEGISESIPIFQIRNASFWARLAPSGQRKLLIIENADRMMESARNALLKILEEPPENTRIVLCSAKKSSLMPTILSRLRQYHFVQRNQSIQKDVIRRVFKEEDTSNVALSDKKRGSTLLMDYLHGFLPLKQTELETAAAFFASSVAAASESIANTVYRKPCSETVREFGELMARIASSSDSEPPVKDARLAVSIVSKKTKNFETRSLFMIFLSELNRLASVKIREAGSGPGASILAASWAAAIRKTQNAVSLYNQSINLALESLFYELAESDAKLEHDLQGVDTDL